MNKMNKINNICVFTTTLKRIFKQPLNWVFLIVFPALFAFLINMTMSGGGESFDTELSHTATAIGIADNDNTIISRTLANQLSLRYNIIEIAENDIAAKLTEQEVPWVLLIKEGYENDVLTGNTALTSLEGYSLTASDVSALGNITTQNITRSLMLLGTNDEEVIAQWAEASTVRLSIAATEADWGQIAYWLGFYGFISIFTAYFIIKTLLDDKRGGMPDRVGVLPATPRNYLIQGTLAAFAATEITVVLTLLVLEMLYGAIPHFWLMFLLLSLYNLFAVSLVLSITSYAKDLGAASVAMCMIATLSSMLGGLFWPIELVPEFMQKVAWLTPSYWFGQGLRYVNDISFTDFVVPLLFLFGFTIVVLLIGGLKKIQRMDE